jgi:putative oxygen-independent coproporphyrinogen III oxidase
MSFVFDSPTAAYIHIPFCRRRCFYCDFPISVVGDRPPQGKSFGTIAEYVEVLCREIAAATKFDLPLTTIFFGGGTPSLLSVEQLARIMETIARHFTLAADVEISMEIDPGTFDLAHLQGYRSAGVNRVSLGVQSFYLDILQACGRTHTPDDIFAAVEMIHQVDLANFSLDLISGLPHLTLERWQESLTKAIGLTPAHLSIYDLTVEPGTSFDRWYEPGAAPLPTDEMTAQMYRAAQKTLTAAGYEHYEISNYGRSGFQCRHNRVYWENRAYYGFGMAAASYVGGQRFVRPRKRREYFEWVEASEKGSGIDCAVVSGEERLLDTLMLGLRLADGLDVGELRAALQIPQGSEFGDALVERVIKTLQPYEKMGWVAIDDFPNQRIKLTDPEGFLFSNVLLSTLFEKLG